MTQDVYIIKADGQRELFDPKKLEESLSNAGASKESITHILQIIHSELTDGLTTREIYRHAFDLLKKSNKHVAVNYSLRRAIMDMGPSGFPFEQLIAGVFEKRGYKVLTGQMLRGSCVEHEIDVLAYNDTELHLIEAKFHNQLGVKTDTKVALYVKARYDDFKDVDIVLDSVKRKMTKGWLITNTKFTKSAIEYGMCQGLAFVGWNYPRTGNLHDMIREAGLHPLTSLTTTSKAQENMLMEKNIVFLRQIQARPEVLQELGMSEEKQEGVLAEVKTILEQSVD